MAHVLRGYALLRIEDDVYSEQMSIEEVIPDGPGDLVLLQYYEWVTGTPTKLVLRRLYRLAQPEYRVFHSMAELRDFMEGEGARHNDRILRARHNRPA